MIRIFKDNTSPSITDTITVDGTAVDLTGSAVKFQMRAVGTQVLKVDAAATIVTAASGTVRYDWSAPNVDTAGDYIAWWEVTLPSTRVQDTPEFAIQIVSHDREAGHLCGLNHVRDLLQKPSGDRDQDAVVLNLIGRASRLIMEWTGREFATLDVDANGDPTPATRLFDCRGWTDFALTRGIPVGDMAVTPTTITILDSAGDTVDTIDTSTEAVYLPLNRAAHQPITAIRLRPAAPGLSAGYQLSILSTWGYPSVPDDVVHYCAQTVGLWMRREVQAIATTFNLTEDRLERPEAIPSAVRQGLTRYRIPPVY